MNEQWADVSDFPGYQVSDLGRCRSSKSRGLKDGEWKILKPYISSRTGYPLICLLKNGRQYRFLMHRLILKAFVGEPPTPDHQACHFDGSKTNNSVANLRWDTRKANAADTRRHGRVAFGERNPLAKLTGESVREIRRLFCCGVTPRAIAKMFGIHKTSVFSIVKRMTWAHVA